MPSPSTFFRSATRMTGFITPWIFAFSASAGTHADLAQFEITTPRPFQSPSLGDVQSMGGAFSYVRQDQVFLTHATFGCPLCVGCRCVLMPTVLDSFMLAPELRGLSLQASVRATNSDTALYFLALGGGNRVFRAQYRKQGSGWPPATERILFDTLTLNVPGGTGANAGLVYHGIDSLRVSAAGVWSFRLFGNRGLRAVDFTVDASGVVNARVASRVAESLTVTASGRGVYGTTSGHVLDSALGYGNPVKLFDRPVVMVTDSGAVSDSGGIAVREFGGWRAFRTGNRNLRDFRILKTAPPIGSGDSGKGAWGTHAEVWNDSLGTATHFLKDDSTVWVKQQVPVPIAVSGDSVRVHVSAADSILINLFDADRNPARPNILITRSTGGRDSLNALWKGFRTGCAGGFNDTVACLPWEPAVPLKISWNNQSVRLKFDVKRGRWQRVMGDLTNGNFYHAFMDVATLSYQEDTTLLWSKGDTVVVRLFNSTFKLAHDGESASLRNDAARRFGFSARVVGRQIAWSRTGMSGDGATVPLVWSLRDARGVTTGEGTLAGEQGRLTLEGERGIHWLEIRDPSSRTRVWIGRIALP